MDQKRKDILKRGIDVTLYPLPFRKGGKIQGAPQMSGGGQVMNKNLGSKTTKPGVEYANGGGLPPKRPGMGMDATRMATPKIDALRKGFTGKPSGYAEFMMKSDSSSRFNANMGPTMRDKLTGNKKVFNNGGPLNTPDSTGRPNLSRAFVSMGNPPPQFQNRAQHDSHHKAEVVKRMQTSHPDLFHYYNQAMAQGNVDAMDAAIMATGGIPNFVPPVQTPSTKTPTDWKNLGFAGSNKTGGYQYNAGMGKPAKGATTNVGMGVRKSKFNK